MNLVSQKLSDLSLGRSDTIRTSVYNGRMDGQLDDDYYSALHSN